ncbi:hypothetical protein AB1Y20_004739 [Prymnesium parvum]|uniref:Uncharacterized protein n=1 Tax=Prymnesium parvum TaxID=97485 RepID=A0AB34J005_PRYPA
MGEAGDYPAVAPSNPWGAEERRPPRPPHPKRLGYAHVLGDHSSGPLRPVIEQSDASPQKRRRWEVSHAPLALPTDSGQFVFLTKPEAGHVARTSACQQAVPPRPPEFMLRRAADLHLAVERNPSPRVMPRRMHADLDSAVEAWRLAPSRVAAARVGRRVGRDRPPLPLDSRWLKREAREHSVARLRRKPSQPGKASFQWSQMQELRVSRSADAFEILNGEDNCKAFLRDLSADHSFSTMIPRHVHRLHQARQCAVFLRTKSFSLS